MRLDWSLVYWIANVGPGCDLCWVMVRITEFLAPVLVLGYILALASLWFMNRHRDWPWFCAYLVAMIAELAFRPGPGVPEWWFAWTQAIILPLRCAAVAEMGSRLMIARRPTFRKRLWWTCSAAGVLVVLLRIPLFQALADYPIILVHGIVSVFLFGFICFALMPYFVIPIFRMPHVKQHLHGLALHVLSFGALVFLRPYLDSSTAYYGVQAGHRLLTLVVCGIYIAPAVSRLARWAVVASGVGKLSTASSCRCRGELTMRQLRGTLLEKQGV